MKWVVQVVFTHPKFLNYDSNFLRHITHSGHLCFDLNLYILKRSCSVHNISLQMLCVVSLLAA